MNWKDLPLNKSKLYLKGPLLGGCDVYVPIAEDSTTVEIDKVRNELQSFILWQEYECLHGDDLA